MKKLRLTDLPKVYSNESPLEAARKICEIFPAVPGMETSELSMHKKFLTDLLKEAKYDLAVREIVHSSYTLPPKSYIERNGTNDVYLVIRNKGDGSRTIRYRERLQKLSLTEEVNGKLKVKREFASLLELMDSKGYQNFKDN